MSYHQWGGNTNWNYHYKKINKNNIYSAGILPYTFDQQGNCLFLLGKDHNGDWSDFGGRCEFKDQNDEKNTASREFYEETLGSVISINDCIEKINGNPVKIVSKTLNGSPYYMYLVYIEHSSNYLDTFHKISGLLKYYYSQDKKTLNKMIEKINIRWVNMDTVLNCLDNKNIGGPITLRGVFYTTLGNCKDQLLFLKR
jgi:hypothetical protein